MSGNFTTPVKARAGRYLMAALALVLLLPVAPLVGQYLFFDFNSAPGARQTFTALNFIAHGWWPGRDFIPYIGLGPVIVAFPLFGLLGGTPFAAFASSVAVSLYAMVWSGYFLVRLLGGRRRTAVFIALGLALWGLVPMVWARPQYLAWLVHSGSSMLAIRALWPFLVAALLLALEKRFDAAPGWPAWRPFVWGLAVGPGPLWANDSGVSTLIALVVVYLAFRCRPFGPRAALVDLGKLLAGAAAGFAFFLTLSSLGHPAMWWRETLAVARDQFWFFAPFDAGHRIFGWQDLFASLFGAGRFDAGWFRLLALPVFAVVFIGQARRPQPRLRPVLILFLALAGLISGLLSSVGGHHWERYYAPFFRAVLFVAALLPATFNLPVPGLGRWRQVAEKLPAMTVGLVLVGHVGLALVAAYSLNIRRGGETAVYVPELGARVALATARRLQTFRAYRRAADGRAKPARQRIFSAEPSAIDVVAGAQPPSPYGWIYHALGEGGRERYRQRLEAHGYDWVTVPATGAARWWQERAAWYFYKAVFQRYRPVGRLGGVELWQPGAGLVDTDLARSFRCRITANGPDRVGLAVRRIDRGAVIRGMAEIEISYRLSLPSSGLLFPGHRLLLTVAEQSAPGVVSRFAIPAAAESWRFPVALGGNREGQVLLHAEGAEIPMIRVDHCAVKSIVRAVRVDDAAGGPGK